MTKKTKQITITQNGQDFEVPEFINLPFDAIDLLMNLTTLQDADQQKQGQGFIQTIRDLRNIVPEFAEVTKVLDIEDTAHFIKSWVEAGQKHGELGKSVSVGK